MKKIMIPIIIFICSIQILYSQSGWTNNFIIAAYSLWDITFTNLYTGYIVGSRTGPFPYNTYSKIILKTIDSGNNWNTIYSDETGGLFSICFVNENTGYCAGGNDFFPCQILKTTNKGLNWTYQLSSNDPKLNKIFFPSENIGYAALDNGYYKTTNAGLNWIKYQISPMGNFSDLFFFNSDSGFILSNSYATNILKTTNGGMNWDIQTTYNFNDGLTSILFNNDFIGLVTGLHNNGTGFIDKTTNGGINWFNIYSTPNMYMQDICFVSPTSGYAIGNSGNFEKIVIKTSNSGVNWYNQYIPSGGQIRSTRIYFTNSLTGFITATGGILYKTTTGGDPIGIQPIQNEIPNNFFLHQNYPNPFNPVTKIRFDIPPSPLERAGVRLVVYDILGREVSTLVNETLKPGTYEVDFDGSSFASGVYFYSLITNDYTETKKLILLK